MQGQTPYTGLRRTGWEDVKAELIPVFPEFAEQEIDAWERRRPAAVEPLRAAVSQNVYRVTPDEVRPLLKPEGKQWPFPPDARKAGWEVPEIEDMTGGLPLAYGLHLFVETNGTLPSWLEAAEWFASPSAACVLYHPAWKHYRTGTTRRGQPLDEAYDKVRWAKGINWRIGKAYISFVREMHLLSHMVHVQGIPLRTHALADAVLKTDFWHEGHVICLYSPNNVKHRKVSPPAGAGAVSDVKAGAGTNIAVNRDGSERKLAWNEINVATDWDLEELAERIRTQSC